MKSNILIRLLGVLMFSLLIAYLPAQVKIGDNPSTQDPSAILELEKTNMGLLITRVELTDTYDIETIPTPANSLLVYNTNYGGEGTEAVSPGFYYFREDEGRWIRLQTGTGNGGDIWIDDNFNILSRNSANQALEGQFSVIIGDRAFADDNGPSDNVIAIGVGAAEHDSAGGDAKNIAIGYQASYQNTGFNVTFLGREAGYNNKNHDVVGIGDYAGYENKGFNVNALGNRAASGNLSENVNAFGESAAEFNEGIEVNALGYLAARHNLGESVNAMGENAALNNIGSNVNAFGFMAAQNNLVDADDPLGSVNALGDYAAANNKGSLVNALGSAAGENNAGWSGNFLGSQSGQFNQGAEVNAMGAMSAQYNTEANVNAFGLEAARYNNGYGTTAIGYWAAKYNDGGQNIAIGDKALMGGEWDFEGGLNIGIGWHAGINISGGMYNICIGSDTPIPNPSANNQINIGNNIIREENAMIRLKDFIRLTPLGEPPYGAEEGSVYYDNALQKLRVLTASGWQDLN